MKNPVHILYLEDNPRDAELVRDKLQQIGIASELQVAGDRAAYEAALAQARFDLILSDYRLPDYDGLAALALAQAKQPEVPFILISGTVGEEQAVDCVLRGATDYVLKDHLERLEPAVLRALTEAEAQQKQREAEAALRASEVRYRRLFEAAKDGILILDAETGMVVDVNPFLIELLGFPRETFIGKQLWELGFFEDLVANQASLAELQEKKYIRYDDKPLQTADGRQIDVEFVSNVYQVGNQKVIQCNIRDITERKRVDDALRRQGHYAALRADVWKLAADDTLSSESLIECLLGRLGSALEVDRACYNVFEHGDPERDDIVCTHEWCASGVSPSLGSRLPSTIARHLLHREGAVLNAESALAMAPAIARPLLMPVIEMYQRIHNIESVLVLPFPPEGAIEGVLTFDLCRDQPTKPRFSDDDRAIVGEVAAIMASHLARRRAQEALRESEQRYRTFIDATSDIVFLKDESFRYLISNGANCAFLGQSELAVKGHTDFDFMTAAMAEHCRASDRKALEKKESVVAEEAVGPKTYQTVKFPVPLTGGRVGVGGFIRDITESKRVDQQLKSQLEELQRWQDVMLGREDRVFEIKKEVNALLAQAGQPPRYPSAVEDVKRET